MKSFGHTDSQRWKKDGGQFIFRDVRSRPRLSFMAVRKKCGISRLYS